MTRGHIRDRSGPRGQAWEVRVYGAGGRRITRTVHGTRKEAERIRTKLLAEVDTGGHAGPDGTFAELLTAWSTLKVTRWSPKTALETKGMIDRWIAPTEKYSDRRPWTPGRLRVSQVTTAGLDTYYQHLTADGLSPAAVRRIHGVVRAALEQACRWGWLLRNPAAYTEPIEGRSAEISPPSPADLHRLLEHLVATEPAMATFVRLAVVTGHRRGELCALRWPDIDLQAGTVTFARTLADSIDAGWVERPISKNQKLFPPIALDQITIDMLRAHRRATAEDLLQLGLRLPADGHVFVQRPGPGRTPMAAWSPTGASRRFDRIRKAVGLDQVRLHDLRDFAATTMIDGGLPISTAAGRLGHGDGGRTTQDRYAHWVPATDRVAAELLARALDETG